MSGEKRRFLWRGFALGLTIVAIAFVSGRPNRVNKVLASSTATRRAAIITRTDQGFKAEAKRGNDLATYTFTTPRGSKITAYFTDDLAASDTLTGTVETEPAGKTPSEISKSQDELQGCVIEVAKRPSPVTEKILTRTLPSIVTSEVRDIVLKYRGEEVARGELPVAETTPPAPTDITLPTAGQHGRPIAVNCPCAERSPQDYLKIGGTILPELASSPRKKVFRNTSETVGMTQIECQHASVVKRGEFRNIGIQLAAPNTQLKRGEKTTLRVTVNGLEGIKRDVQLEMENRSPDVISMEGGVNQRTMIHPSDVKAGGLYRTERALTGIKAGSFNILGSFLPDFWELYFVRPCQYDKKKDYCNYTVVGSSGGGALANESWVCLVCSGQCPDTLSMTPAPGIYYDLRRVGDYSGCSVCPSPALSDGQRNCYEDIPAKSIF